MQFLSTTLNGIQEAFLDEEESYHAIKVLRHKKGDEIKVFDGKNQYLARIKDIVDSKVLIHDFKLIPSLPKNYRINLFLPFIDKKEFEDTIRHSTELGVDSFIPIITDYTQKFFVPMNFDEKRFQRVIISAVKQSERDSIPDILKPIKFSEIIGLDENFIVGWVSKHQNESNLKESLKFLRNNKVVNIIIGPEGGFSEREEKMILDSDRFLKISISKNILRVKTASIAIISCIIFLLENENIF